RCPVGCHGGGSGHFLLPARSDEIQFALDRAANAVEPGCDLVVGIAFHLQQGNGTEVLVLEQFEQPVTLLRHLGRQLRRRFATKDVLNRPTRVPPPGKVRLAEDGAPPALLPHLVMDLVADLADRDRHQQVPQVAAVVHLREAPLFGAPAEAVEGAEDRVFLVRGPPRRLPQPRPRQADQPAGKASPQRLSRFAVPRLQGVEPPGDGLVVRHARPSTGDRRGEDRATSSTRRTEYMVTLHASSVTHVIDPDAYGSGGLAPYPCRSCRVKQTAVC